MPASRAAKRDSEVPGRGVHCAGHSVAALTSAAIWKPEVPAQRQEARRTVGITVPPALPRGFFGPRPCVRPRPSVGWSVPAPTWDTKGIEIAFVRDLLATAGIPTLVIDAGVLNVPAFPGDVARETVFTAAGTSLAALQKAGDRGQAIEAAMRGVTAAVRDLLAQGRVDGVLALGGSAGTTIGTAAMRALPFGVPKIMVSTLASGQVRQYVGVRDLLMMHSVVDISGLNRISRTVLANAAGAMIGMVRQAKTPPPSELDKPLPDGDHVRCDDALRRGGAGWS